MSFLFANFSRNFKTFLEIFRTFFTFLELAFLFINMLFTTHPGLHFSQICCQYFVQILKFWYHVFDEFIVYPWPLAGTPYTRSDLSWTKELSKSWEERELCHRKILLVQIWTPPSCSSFSLCPITVDFYPHYSKKRLWRVLYVYPTLDKSEKWYHLSKWYCTMCAKTGNFPNDAIGSKNRHACPQ